LAQYSPAIGPPAPCIAHDASSRVAEKVCRIGDASSSKLIVIMGDSHALMWMPALLAMADRDGWAVVPLLRLGCSPDKWISATGPASCRAWSRWAEARVEQLHPTVVLLAGSIPEIASSGTRVAVDGILGAAQRLASRERLIVIGDPESLSFEPVDCLLRSRASMASCTTSWPESSLAAYDAIERGAARLGAGFLATRGFVCYDGDCPAVIAHMVVWGDNSHLTVAYSQALAAPFRASFIAALAAARR
jgi:hypothetical protein